MWLIELILYTLEQQKLSFPNSIIGSDQWERAAPLLAASWGTNDLALLTAWCGKASNAQQSISQRLKMNGMQISLYTACHNGACFWYIKSTLDYATLPVASFYLQLDFRVWSLSSFALTHCKLVSAACFKWIQQTRVCNQEPKKAICSMHSYGLHTQ